MNLSYKGNKEGFMDYLLDKRFMLNKFAQDWKAKLESKDREFEDEKLAKLQAEAEDAIRSERLELGGDNENDNFYDR